MEFFESAAAVRLKGCRGKYLCARDNRSVSQERNRDERATIWIVEKVTGSSHVVRLKSSINNGLYLTALEKAFLLGERGNKVQQSYSSKADSAVEWQPLLHHHHHAEEEKKNQKKIKLRTKRGTYLRANRGIPPYKNSVTHDSTNKLAGLSLCSFLWEVEIAVSDCIVDKLPIAIAALDQLQKSVKEMDREAIIPPKKIEAHKRLQNQISTFQEEMEREGSLPPKKIEAQKRLQNQISTFYEDSEQAGEEDGVLDLHSSSRSQQQQLSRAPDDSDGSRDLHGLSCGSRILQHHPDSFEDKKETVIPRGHRSPPHAGRGNADQASVPVPRRSHAGKSGCGSTRRESTMRTQLAPLLPPPTRRHLSLKDVEESVKQYCVDGQDSSSRSSSDDEDDEQESKIYSEEREQRLRVSCDRECTIRLLPLSPDDHVKEEHRQRISAPDDREHMLSSTSADKKHRISSDNGGVHRVVVTRVSIEIEECRSRVSPHDIKDQRLRVCTKKRSDDLKEQSAARNSSSVEHNGKRIHSSSVEHNGKRILPSSSVEHTRERIHSCGDRRGQFDDRHMVRSGTSGCDRECESPVASPDLHRLTLSLEDGVEQEEFPHHKRSLQDWKPKVTEESPLMREWHHHEGSLLDDDEEQQQNSSRISLLSSRPRSGGGRSIFFTVADDNSEYSTTTTMHKERSFILKSNSVSGLRQELQAHMKIEEDIFVCIRNPVNGKLCILMLELLPPDNASMRVVVVRANSEVGRKLWNPQSVRSRR